MKRKLTILAVFAVLSTSTGCMLSSISIADGLLKVEANLPTGDE